MSGFFVVVHGWCAWQSGTCVCVPCCAVLLTSCYSLRFGCLPVCVVMLTGVVLLLCSLAACCRFYAPQLFQAAGQGADAALLSTVITGVSHQTRQLVRPNRHCAPLVAPYAVDLQEPTYTTAAAADDAADDADAASPVLCCGCQCGVCFLLQCVNVASTVVAIILVDRLGRRFLFIEGGIQMILCEVRSKSLDSSRGTGTNRRTASTMRSCSPASVN